MTTSRTTIIRPLAALAGAAALACAMLLPQPAHALSFYPTESEWVVWPEYCQARYVVSAAGSDTIYARRVPQSLVKSWEARLGSEVWYSLHHFCAGLILSERARLETDKTKREFQLRNVIGEYSYSYDRMPQGHAMRAEIAARLGLVYRDLGELDAAVQFLDRAIEDCPTCAVGYLSKAIFHRSRDELPQARAVLEKGVEATGGESAEVHYNLGLVLTAMKDYEAARIHARKAYERGYPLQGLRKQLAKAGHPLE